MQKLFKGVALVSAQKSPVRSASKPSARSRQPGTAGADLADTVEGVPESEAMTDLVRERAFIGDEMRGGHDDAALIGEAMGSEGKVP